MRAVLGCALLWGLGSCASGYDMADTGLRWITATEGAAVPLELRVDVFPAVNGTKDDGYRALPQTAGPFLIPSGNLDIGEINLRRPLLVAGDIQGVQVQPSPATKAELPGTAVPVEATVHLTRQASVQQYGTRSDGAGSFQLSAVPQDTYIFEIIPDNPMLPAFFQELVLTDTAPEVDVDIGYGAALHGRVTSEDGTPVPGARIYAVTPYGTETAEVQTDAQGYYELRVMEGVYGVHCAGRGFPSVDPNLSEQAVEVMGTGKRIDFTYNALTDILAEGQVMNANSEPLGNVTVRFTSRSLEGYDKVLAQASFDAQTNAKGVFARRILPGTYTVEYLPDSLQLSPVLVDDVALTSKATQLDPMTLDSLVTLEGYVLDPYGDAVPRTQISCVEAEFTHRRFVTETDSQGIYVLRAPRVLLDCTLTPPGDRTDLPMTQLVLDTAPPVDTALVYSKGVLVTGSIALDGEPEPSALVELTTTEGHRLGASLSDSTGAFRLVIAREE